MHDFLCMRNSSQKSKKKKAPIENVFRGKSLELDEE